MILYDCGGFIYEMQKIKYKKIFSSASNHTERMSVTRNILLNVLIDYTKKYKSKYGNLVLCFDGKGGYWRKDFFPYYKSNRKKYQEKDSFDWQELFICINELYQEFTEYLPVVSLNIDKCEADDIIACLCKYFQDNETDILGNPSNHIIISNDHDLSQLQFYDGITNFSPRLGKEIVLNNKEVHELLITHICCGDAGDGVMNICSDDDVFINEDKKQNVFRKSRLEEFFNDGINACKNDTEKRNFQRNKKLVDLINEIPDEYYNKIIEDYKNFKCNYKINEYVMKYRLGNLYAKIQFLL